MKSNFKAPLIFLSIFLIGLAFRTYCWSHLKSLTWDEGLHINRKGSSLISLLIALVIIGIIFLMLTKTWQRSEEQETMMKDAGINTSSYKTMLDSARKVAENASKPK